LLNNRNYNFNFKNGIPCSRKRPEINETLIEKYLLLFVSGYRR
jgi:hypothetical protein